MLRKGRNTCASHRRKFEGLAGVRARRKVTRKKAHRLECGEGVHVSPLFGVKRPRVRPPGPLLTQGVNLPRGVWAGRGLESTLCFPASSVQHGEPWSLDVVAGVRARRKVTRKKAHRKRCACFRVKRSGRGSNLPLRRFYRVTPQGGRAHSTDEPTALQAFF